MRTRVPVLVFRSGPHKIGVQSELSPHKYTNTSARTYTHTHTHKHTHKHTHTVFCRIKSDDDKNRVKLFDLDKHKFRKDMFTM